MPDSLRDRLLGAWRLLDALAEPVDGSTPHRPHGPRPAGLILYTPDGHVSVQIMEPDRAVPESTDWTALTPEEYAAEGRTYFGYAGRFDVDEAAGTVTHHVEVSLFPGWVGDGQLRLVELEGNRLTLSTPTPFLTGGKLVRMRLNWERASG